MHAHLIIRFLDAALQNVHHAELLRDLRKIIRRTFEMLRRSARDYFEVGDFRQTGENFVLYSLGEISVSFFFAEIVKSQHGNGLRWKFTRWTRVSKSVTTKKEEPDREDRANNGDVDPRVFLLSHRGRHCVGNFCALDSLWSYFKRPRDHESDRKTDRDQSDDQSHNPVRNFQERKDLGRNLDKQPANDRIRDCDLVNVATLQFTEKGLRVHRFSGRTLTTNRPSFARATARQARMNTNYRCSGGRVGCASSFILPFSIFSARLVRT